MRRPGTLEVKVTFSDGGQCDLTKYSLSDSTLKAVMQLANAAKSAQRVITKAGSGESDG